MSSKRQPITEDMDISENSLIYNSIRESFNTFVRILFVYRTSDDFILI